MPLVLRVTAVMAGWEYGCGGYVWVVGVCVIFGVIGSLVWLLGCVVGVFGGLDC